MSTPNSPNGLHDRALDDIALLALGEHVDPSIEGHIRSCAECQRELGEYQHVVRVARDSGRSIDAEGPPESVWDHIVGEIGAPERRAPIVPIESARWRRPLLAAATVVALAGAGAGGWAIGHSGSSGTSPRASQATLAAQPGMPASAHGTATVHTSANGYTLNVAARDLPARDGYYEVWLYNPSVNRMIAVGTLGTGGRGSFTVPAGLDLDAYHVVDVSAQKYDGNPAHEQSVLRGEFTG